VETESRQGGEKEGTNPHGAVLANRRESRNAPGAGLGHFGGIIKNFRAVA
jgi:hypothetical protein